MADMLCFVVFHLLQLFSVFIMDLYKAISICVGHIAYNVLRTSDVFPVRLAFTQYGSLEI